jgi:hypothetical protein
VSRNVPLAEQHYQAITQFEPHSRHLLDLFFEDENLCDLRQDPLIDHWSDSHLLYCPLRILLLFGRHLSQLQVNFITSRHRTSRLLNACRTQLLYWLLARTPTGPHRTPVSSIVIYYELDQFWFNHFLTTHLTIQRRLREGQQVFFLSRFSLNHEYIDLEFSELRLVGLRDPKFGEGILNYHTVHCPGVSYKRNLLGEDWVITRLNNDPNLVDPTGPVYYPPAHPGDTNFARYNPPCVIIRQTHESNSPLIVPACPLVLHPLSLHQHHPHLLYLRGLPLPQTRVGTKPPDQPTARAAQNFVPVDIDLLLLLHPQE